MKHRCERTSYVLGTSQTIKCGKEAVEILWSKTWINRDGTMPRCVEGWESIKRGNNDVSDNPPMHVCADCLEFYTKHDRGFFLYGASAMEAYNKGLTSGLK